MNEIFSDLRITEMLTISLGAFVWWKLQKIDRSVEDLKEHRLICTDRYVTKDIYIRLENRVEEIDQNVYELAAELGSHRCADKK